MATTSYDIVTVDWNKNQTAMWKYYIEKNCPTANIITLPESRPVKWSRFSSKMNILLFDKYKHPDRIMYTDTDCLITDDLLPLFEYMEECDFDMAASVDFLPRMNPFTGKHAKNSETMAMVKAYMGVTEFPHQYSSGMLLFRPGVDRKELYDKWMVNFTDELLMKHWGGISIMEEIALSYVLQAIDYKMWYLPREVHGNVLRKSDFGSVKVPMVIHYHKPARLRWCGLECFLREYENASARTNDT